MIFLLKLAVEIRLLHLLCAEPRSKLMYCNPQTQSCSSPEFACARLPSYFSLPQIEKKQTGECSHNQLQENELKVQNWDVLVAAGSALRCRSCKASCL